MSLTRAPMKETRRAAHRSRAYLCLVVVLACAGCALTSDRVGEATPVQHVAVVFDIDGTLTPAPVYINTARPGAAAAVQAFADGGYRIVYLTARTTLFQSGIPGWLEQNGFPEGSIHVTQTAEDRRDHEAFKYRVLEEYRADGWTFVAAYGDSTSDFEAYARAGIDTVYALQRKGKKACQPGVWLACYANWPEQSENISRLIHGPD